MDTGSTPVISIKKLLKIQGFLFCVAFRVACTRKLKNYDGTDLGEFRQNLATYGALKVCYDGEMKGGAEMFEIAVNAENYKAIIEIFKKALIENAMGYDAKDDSSSGNPNQMNIMSMYSDIDLDANDMETGLQATFDNILWFMNNHLANTGKGSFEGEEVNIIFNRDILINLLLLAWMKV